MMDVDKAEIFIEELLESRLSPSLFYHDYFHTRDVLTAALHLAKEEGVTNETDLKLLKTAALFHDCGYVDTYENHEEEGCRIARDTLPGFGYSDEQVETICKMIMQTKLPSKPQTLLEKILCDADLDYLGRDDFFTLGDKLGAELIAAGKLDDINDWDPIQVNFLQSHRYYTASAIAKRQKKKEEYLRYLKQDIQDTKMRKQNGL